MMKRIKINYPLLLGDGFIASAVTVPTLLLVELNFAGFVSSVFNINAGVLLLILLLAVVLFSPHCDPQMTIWIRGYIAVFIVIDVTLLGRLISLQVHGDLLGLVLIIFVTGSLLAMLVTSYDRGSEN